MQVWRWYWRLESEHRLFRRPPTFISVLIGPASMPMEESPRNPYFPVRLKLTVIGKVKPVSLQPQNIIMVTPTFQSNIFSF
jgi:hypothetical protein